MEISKTTRGPFAEMDQLMLWQVGVGYDANGNTTSKTDSTGTTNYSWDFENRLTLTCPLDPQGGSYDIRRL